MQNVNLQEAIEAFVKMATENDQKSQDNQSGSEELDVAMNQILTQFENFNLSVSEAKDKAASLLESYGKTPENLAVLIGLETYAVSETYEDGGCIEGNTPEEKSLALRTYVLKVSAAINANIVSEERGIFLVDDVLKTEGLPAYAEVANIMGLKMIRVQCSDIPSKMNEECKKTEAGCVVAFPSETAVEDQEESTQQTQTSKEEPATEIKEDEFNNCTHDVNLSFHIKGIGNVILKSFCGEEAYLKLGNQTITTTTDTLNYIIFGDYVSAEIKHGRIMLLRWSKF